MLNNFFYSNEQQIFIRKKIYLIYFLFIMEISTKEKKPRKYNTEFRKKLVSKFDNIKDRSDLHSIYNIITKDIGTNFSSNRNGLFINMNILSDNCIEKLVNYIDDRATTSLTMSDKVNYKSYKIDDIDLISESGQKLSNQEKNIIKRIRNKIII